MTRPPAEPNPWLWPLNAALRISIATLTSFEELISSGSPSEARAPEPAWTTPRRTVLDLPVLRVHDFGGSEAPLILLVAPFALHGPVLADLAPGHSLVQRLLAERVGRVLLLDCKSATPAMRFTRPLLSLGSVRAAGCP